MLFCLVAACGLVIGYESFGGTCCLVRLFDMLVSIWASTRHHKLEEQHKHLHRHENFYLTYCIHLQD